jgi:predicted kinase
MQPILFYTIGYPGAGKSTFATHLARWFGNEPIRADVIGMGLFPMPTFSETERKATYQLMDYQSMEQLNAHKTVLYDGTLNTSAERMHLLDVSAQCKAKAVGLWLDVPRDVAKERAARLRDVGIGGLRGRMVPPEVFDQHAARFEAPGQGESFIQIDGLKPFGYQYRYLRHALARYGIDMPAMIEL